MTLTNKGLDLLITSLDKRKKKFPISTKMESDGSKVIEITMPSINDPHIPSVFRAKLNQKLTKASETYNINKRGSAMDSKKIIEKLVKIANSQQKIINRLAQQVAQTGVIPTAGTADAASQQLSSAQKIFNLLKMDNSVPGVADKIPMGAGGLTVEDGNVYYFTRNKADATPALKAAVLRAVMAAKNKEVENNKTGKQVDKELLSLNPSDKTVIYRPFQ